MKYDNCKGCKNRNCEHFGKDREFVCMNGISCKQDKEDAKMGCSVAFEKKEGKTFKVTWRSEDRERVYEDLAHELIEKKINGCTYIRSITRKQLYTGFVKITVAYDNGDRRVYHINDH